MSREELLFDYVIGPKSDLVGVAETIGCRLAESGVGSNGMITIIRVHALKKTTLVDGHELKHCPMCEGGEGQDLGFSERHIAGVKVGHGGYCSCGLSGPTHTKKRLAASLWNTMPRKGDT